MSAYMDFHLVVDFDKDEEPDPTVAPKKADEALGEHEVIRIAYDACQRRSELWGKVRL